MKRTPISFSDMAKKPGNPQPIVKRKSIFHSKNMKLNVFCFVKWTVGICSNHLSLIKCTVRFTTLPFRTNEISMFFYLKIDFYF